MATLIKRTTINLSKVSDYFDGEHDRLILKGLTKADLLSDEFVYTVFNGARIPTVAQTGLTIPPSESVFYAFKRAELAWANGQPNCLKVCTKQYLEPAIAVYNLVNLQTPIIASSKFGYEFKNKSQAREALRGIVRLVTPATSFRSFVQLV